MVTRPKRQGFKPVIRNPFQVAFVVLLQFPAKILGDKDEDIPIIALESGEDEQSTQARLAKFQPGFFANLPDDTLFGGLARFELASQTVPFAQVDIVRALDAVDHESLTGALKVTQGGEDHLLALRAAISTRAWAWPARVSG